MKLAPEDLEQWLLHMQSVHSRGLDLSLDRVHRVRHILRLRRCPIVITIGGTNGKGSSAGMLESVLHHAGKRVGTYTSPHLINYQERIRISGTPVGESELLDAFLKVENARQGIPLTFFEFGTLTALLMFQEAGVQVAILEVGMGGRLDAVNTENQDVALLTPIAMDHEQWLGSDREQIGAEKAGIMKFKGRVVINDPDPPRSVLEKARSLHCKLYQYGVDYRSRREGQFWSWESIGSGWSCPTMEKQLPATTLVGEHQLLNASGVLAVLNLIRTEVDVPRASLEKGFGSQFIRARLEIYKIQPQVIVDVAHNLSAANYLLKFLCDRPIDGKTFAIFSMLRDKPAKKIVEILAPVIDKWHIVELQGERALPLSSLKKVMNSVHIHTVRSWESPQEALLGTRGDARDADRIVVFGSTYLAGAILQVLDNEGSCA